MAERESFRTMYARVEAIHADVDTFLDERTTARMEDGADEAAEIEYMGISVHVDAGVLREILRLARLGLATERGSR